MSPSCSKRTKVVTLSKLDYAVLAAVAGIYLLVGLDAYGLLDNNEGLYAEIAREMLENGSFVVPRLDGVPYLEKPPLLAWLLAGAYAAWGQSEFVSRLVPLSATLSLAVALIVFGRSLQRPFLGWLAAVILLTSCAFALMSRTVFPDVLLTALFGAAMMLFFCWHRRKSRKLLVASYCLVGLAVLAKGFLALALGAAVFLIFGTFRERSWRIRDLADPYALAGLALIVLPWHVALALEDGQFAWFYLVDEHVLRYLGLRAPKDYYTGPVWYYLPRMLMYLFPWSAFAALLPLKDRNHADPDADLERFLWIWLGATLAFFSFSEAKANYYMVLGMPALALLLAGRIERLVATRDYRPIALCALAATVAAAIGLAVVHYGLWTPRRHGLWWFVLRRRDELVPALLALALVTGIAAALFAAAHHRIAVYATALAGVPLLVFAVSTAVRADRYASARAVAQYVESRYPGARVLVYQDYERLSSLPFYLKRRVGVIDSRSNDLAFGMRRAPDREPFLTSDGARSLTAARHAVILVHRKRLGDFTKEFNGSGLARAARVGNIFVYEGRPLDSR